MMNDRKLLCCILVLSTVVATWLTTMIAYGADTNPAFTFDADDTTEQVRELFRKGSAQMVASDFEGAHQTLLEAWSIRQTSDVACALGQVELATKHFRDAAEHLNWSLSHFPPVESEKTLQQTRALLAQAKQHVAQVQVSASRDGAEIRIDGKPVGSSPLSAPLFLESGKHEISGWLGQERASRVIVADSGKEYAINFTFAPGATSAAGNGSATMPTFGTASPTEPTPAPTDSPESARRSIVPVIVGGAVFVVGLSTGIGLELASNSKYDDAKTLQNQVGPTGCANGTSYPSQCAALRATTKSGDRYQNWSTVGFVAAGAALIATPIYWFWPQKKSTNGSARILRHISTSIMPQYSGLALSGEF
jgi:hypothetical protein